MTEHHSVKVTRIEAARRQLTTALELWFAEGDDVSIHTLVGSAHQILHDLNRRKKGPPLFFDSVVIKDEFRAETVAAMKKNMGFFKHADHRGGKNTADSTTFYPMTSEAFAVGAIAAMQILGERLLLIDWAFIRWIEFHRPTWINDEVAEKLRNAFGAEEISNMRKLKKHEFLECFIEAKRRTDEAITTGGAR